MKLAYPSGSTGSCASAGNTSTGAWAPQPAHGLGGFTARITGDGSSRFAATQLRSREGLGRDETCLAGHLQPRSRQKYLMISDAAQMCPKGTTEVMKDEGVIERESAR